MSDLEFGSIGRGGGEGGWLLKYRPHPGIVLEHFMYEEHDFLIRCSDTPEISCTVVVICILATVLDEKVEGRVII